MPTTLRSKVESEIREYEGTKLLAVDVTGPLPRAYLQWRNVLILLSVLDDTVVKQMMSVGDIEVFARHSDWFNKKASGGNQRP